MQRRPKFISFVAGWLIVCAVVGAVVFSVTIPTVDSIETNGDSVRWIVEHFGRGGLLAMILAVYAYVATIGVGLWMMRSWGRLALLVTSVALVAVCIVAFGVAAVRNRSVDFAALINAVVFGWPLYYFNRRKIRMLFT